MPVNYSITPNRIVRFFAPEQRGFLSHSALPGRQVADNSKPNPDFSAQSKRKLKRALNWLIYLSRPRTVEVRNGKRIPNFQVAFVTLTLPGKQMHSHRQIVSKCLNRFLTVARQKWNIENYVWKAELQSNGNIHFHLTWDKCVHYLAIRREWNAAISKLGYIQEYKERMQALSFEDYWHYRKQDGATNKTKARKTFQYQQQLGWTSPNSTDVHKVRDVRNLAAYLAKYCAKPVGDRSKTGIIADSIDDMRGRLWSCSQSLSRLKTAVQEFSTTIKQFFDWAASFTRKVFWPNDFVTVVFMRASELPRNAREYMRQALVSHAINRLYPFPGGLPV